MNRPIALTGATILLATVGVLSLGEVRGASCSGCAAPTPPPVVVDPHIVTNDQCAVLELRLDGGVVKNICLTASQIERVVGQ
jgi:hypothetical protein